MVKKRLLDDVDAFDKAQRQFLYDFGHFFARWGIFEMLIEVKIQQLANLTPKDAAIILGGLSFGNKPAILYSLLSARGKAKTIPKIKAVINHAKRNALVHSSMGGALAPPRFSFFRREVQDSMKVTVLRFSADEFAEHVEELDRLIAQAMKALRVYGNDVEHYAHEAGLLRPTRKRPQARRRDGAKRKK